MASKGGRGPVPTRPELTVVGATAIAASPMAKAPSMPTCPVEGGWTPRCKRVWEQFWRTAKPAEFDDSCHAHLVERMLLLHLDFDLADKPTTRVGISAELRLIEATLIMTPADLRRAQIEAAKPLALSTAQASAAPARRDPRRE